MPIIKSPLRSKNQTGRALYSFVERFSGDIGSLSKLSLPEYFNLVKRIPYARDKRGEEWIVRPKLLFKEFPEMDCKKKSVLMGSYAKENKIPMRFLAVSEMPNKKFHHVFPQFFIRGAWRNVDATYQRFKLFQNKPRLTKAEILKP